MSARNFMNIFQRSQTSLGYVANILRQLSFSGEPLAPCLCILPPPQPQPVVGAHV